MRVHQVRVEHVRIKRRIKVGHLVAIEVVRETIGGRVTAPCTMIVESRPRTAAHANRFSRLVSDAQRVEHDRLAANAPPSSSRSCSGPVVAGCADRSLTPCQLTATAAQRAWREVRRVAGVRRQVRQVVHRRHDRRLKLGRDQQHPAIQVAVAQEIDDLGNSLVTVIGCTAAL